MHTQHYTALHYFALHSMHTLMHACMHAGMHRRLPVSQLTHTHTHACMHVVFKCMLIYLYISSRSFQSRLFFGSRDLLHVELPAVVISGVLEDMAGRGLCECVCVCACALSGFVFSRVCDCVCTRDVRMIPDGSPRTSTQPSVMSVQEPFMLL